ncbi:cytochrome P450 [Gymnopus androsaceus JB14]|uniref:Cytochrome P450 n=1 Tax=Gymnopus androsaceus JB14 TaxID=1447944 RepID=A0A6A4H6E9_9AGAR|nr:cytochrome P450 [Gymnopus androsaceus JB14]
MSIISVTPLSQALSLGAIFLLTLVIPKVLRWRARMNKTLNMNCLHSSTPYLPWAHPDFSHPTEVPGDSRNMLEKSSGRLPKGDTSFFLAVHFYAQARTIYVNGQAFKIPHIDRWEVVVSGKEMIEDMKKASDMDLSFVEALRESMQSDYTLGAAPAQDPYHIAVVRTPLTRNLGARFDDIREEIVLAMQDQIPAKGVDHYDSPILCPIIFGEASEWIKVPMLYTVMKIVSRTSNRFFVGAPLSLYASSRQMFLLAVKRATKHLEPLILERLRKEEEYGSSEWPDKPNDLISWLLDEAQGERRNNIISNIVLRVLHINFGAIHTTSITFTSCLFRLAGNPELVQILREEVEPIIKELGWSKATMGQMKKLDSFMKETQRLSGNVGATSMNRMALRDFTFSNGTVIPAGTIVSVASYAMNRDDEIYEEADTLNPFRFSNMRAQEGESTKHQMAGLDPSYMLFGGGRQMCPGRFFAVNELKALLAHVLVTYDLKFENGGEYPPDEWQGASVNPNRSAMVMFRKRAA